MHNRPKLINVYTKFYINQTEIEGFISSRRDTKKMPNVCAEFEDRKKVRIWVLKFFHQLFGAIKQKEGTAHIWVNKNNEWEVLK